MRCIITGMETNNKWKGYAICKEMVDTAKELIADQPRRYTMRTALQHLQSEWRKEQLKEAEEKKAILAKKVQTKIKEKLQAAGFTDENDASLTPEKFKEIEHQVLSEIVGEMNENN